MRRPEGGGARGVLKEKESGKETESERREKEFGGCVCAGFVRTRATENTCGQRTRADGEHERRQRPAVGQRKKGSRNSLLFFFIYLGIVCV